MVQDRLLFVVADDFGIGPETTRGILELARMGRVTASVLLVNSPYAESSVNAWLKMGQPMDLGWHPCLTLDAPILPPAEIPSLVDSRGLFWKLPEFIKRSLTGRIQFPDVLKELTAQRLRFIELVRAEPMVVNSHQHVALFPPVGRALLELLGKQRFPPYLRSNREAFATLAAVPGARFKRWVLSVLGARYARQTQRAGFCSADCLIGVTDPKHVARPDFFEDWLRSVSGRIVELMCHPGHLDPTLVGRDCEDANEYVLRRFQEYVHMKSKSFPDICHRTGFRLASPSELTSSPTKRVA